MVETGGITFSAARRLLKRIKKVSEMKELTVIIKGAGEMATGIACRLYMANIKNIIMLEIPQPLAVRRTVAFCESIYRKEVVVEGIKGVLVEDLEDVPSVWEHGLIGVMVDSEWKAIGTIKPDVVVDAIMAKKNLGTRKDEAPLVIGVGPGFMAPLDVHAVVESNRGHNLGRAIYEGATEPFTGMPGLTGGFSRERVLRAPCEGLVRHMGKVIGDPVKKDEVLLFVNETPVLASINGILRGLVSEIRVEKNEKIGDIEPGGDVSYCRTISDKARAIAGGVLEAVLHYTAK